MWGVIGIVLMSPVNILGLKTFADRFWHLQKIGELCGADWQNISWFETLAPPLAPWFLMSPLMYQCLVLLHPPSRKEHDFTIIVCCCFLAKNVGLWEKHLSYTSLPWPQSTCCSLAKVLRLTYLLPQEVPYNNNTPEWSV